MQTYQVIDADAHFIEPNEMWPKYLESAFRDMAPRAVTSTSGKYATLVGDTMILNSKHKIVDTPEARLKAMDGEKIQAAVIYPTLALLFGAIPRLDLNAALCRAFNNWAGDYCSVNRERLFASAMVPQVDVFEAVKEARRAILEKGLNGVMLRPNPIGGRNLDHPAWEPMWNLLEELDTPLVIHEGTAPGDCLPTVGIDRFDNYNFKHAVSHPFEQMIALLTLVCGGVLERHPRLRVVQVEAGCGWVPYWLERMDHHTTPWHLRGDVKLTMKPSDYFKRQCLVSADPEENMLAVVVSAVGDDNIAFSTDYPHPDHLFEGMVARCAGRTELSEKTRAKILGGNAARCFKIPLKSHAFA